jgi:hypothetical protein
VAGLGLAKVAVPKPGQSPRRQADGRASFGRAYSGTVPFLIALASFGAGVGLAELFGAASLGIAFGFGQIAFVLACVVLLVRA